MFWVLCVYVACLVVLLLGVGVSDLCPYLVMVTAVFFCSVTVSCGGNGCLGVRVTDVLTSVTGWWAVCVLERRNGRRLKAEVLSVKLSFRVKKPPP